MTDRFDPAELAKLAAANRRNKLAIQKKRARDANTLATMLTADLPTPIRRFPSRYKYG